MQRRPLFYSDCRRSGRDWSAIPMHDITAMLLPESRLTCRRPAWSVPIFRRSSYWQSSMN